MKWVVGATLYLLFACFVGKVLRRQGERHEQESKNSFSSNTSGHVYRPDIRYRKLR